LDALNRAKDPPVRDKLFSLLDPEFQISRGPQQGNSGAKQLKIGIL
jgi:hypothetical protein